MIGHSLLSILAILALLACELAAGVPATLAAPVIVLIFALSLIARVGLCDPIPMTGIALFLYSFLPQFVHPAENRFLVVFGMEGARHIYLSAILSYLVSIALAVWLLPWRDRPDRAHDPQIPAIASFSGAALASLLSIAFIARNGMVVGGDVTYASGFELRMQTGAGVFLLAVPLSGAAFAIAAAARKTVTSPSFLMSIVSFVLLYMAHGQRKFLLIPLVLLAAARVKRPGLASIVLFVGGAIVLLNAFSYLGYLRALGIPFASAFEDSVVNGFLRNYATNLAGAETLMLYATASAAYQGVVPPLPLFGDYLLSWMQALPRFLFPAIPYSPFNDRFSAAVTPEAAAVGQGWGFSFWGEAYAVGGEAMIFLAALAVVLFFRAVFLKAGGARLAGAAGPILLISVYYAIWFQRNAFGVILREFLVLHVASVLGLLLVAAAVVRATAPPARPQRVAPRET